MSMWHQEPPVIDGDQHSKAILTPKSDPPREIAPVPRQDGNGDASKWPYASYLELAALRAAPSCARLHTKARLAEWRLSEVSEDAELVASELATNALFASPAVGESPALIRLWLLGDARQLVIVVWDGSRQPPVLTCAPPLAEHGRGIFLVSELSSNWGWYERPDIGGKCIWAQFCIPSAGCLP
jgi:anti-sigma regulatory factor (Ser/Thr protein kinase)